VDLTGVEVTRLKSSQSLLTSAPALMKFYCRTAAFVVEGSKRITVSSGLA
jgi:hypothetical protein